MAKVIGRDTSSEVANSERRRAMDPDVDYEMDQQPGPNRSTDIGQQLGAAAAPATATAAALRIIQTTAKRRDTISKSKRYSSAAKPAPMECRIQC